MTGYADGQLGAATLSAPVKRPTISEVVTQQANALSNLEELERIVDRFLSNVEPLQGRPDQPTPPSPPTLGVMMSQSIALVTGLSRLVQKLGSAI